MPVYEYKCTTCQERFDVEQAFTDDALTTLEGCQTDDDGLHRLKKVFSAVGIAFKGDGFYRNDSRSKPSKSTTAASSTSDGSSDGTGSSKSTESSKSDNSTTSDKSTTSDTSTSSNSSSSTPKKTGSEAKASTSSS